ncbi:hypothetical protein RNJ44_03476 [Nakaseomyces bracarensis]|uniref:Uncharacterized protein n=1 Tax=Nakaseomyces bracarensis TaxID=273131 RepID=A0ABR4NX39_9SACH
METLINTAIDNLININEPVTPAYIKLQLDVIYKQTVKFGLNNAQLEKLLSFLCATNIITDETKLYVIKNCLFPCEYIEKPVISTIINNLGTPTIYSPFQLILKPEIQESLCEWLVKVFFIVKDDVNIDTSIWIHLWQYKYLQKWLTFIIIWSTRFPSDVKTWKISLLKKIGLKSMYKDGALYATAILKKYQILLGYSQVISDAISDLKVPITKLEKLSKLKIQTLFFRQVCEILITTDPDSFTNEMLHKRCDELKNQLSVSVDYKEMLPFVTKNRGIQDTIDINSVKELVSNWNLDHIMVGNVVSDFQDISTPISILPIIKIIHERKLKTLTDVLCDIVKLQVNFIFQSTDHDEKDMFRLLHRVRLFSTVIPGIIKLIRDNFLNAEYLSKNKVFFQLLFGFSPVLSQKNSEYLEVVQKLVFRHTTTALSIENINAKNNTIVPTILTRLYFDIFNLVNCNNNSVNKDITRIFAKLGNLSFNRIFDNPIRFFDISGALYYMTVLNNVLQSNTLYEHIPNIILEPYKLKHIVLQFDPLLLNIVCNYLALAKGTIASYATKKESIKIHNQFLLDLTNYLWRNKISSSDIIFDIPTAFISKVTENLYLPSISRNDKAVFSITGIPATSFVFYHALRSIESEYGCVIEYNSEYSNSGFKKFVSSLPNRDNWIEGIKDFDDLKRLVLKSIAGIEGYNDIALFLYTFIKSLSSNN